MSDLTIIHANILHAQNPDVFTCLPHGYLVLNGGTIEGIYEILPEKYRGAPLED